MKRSSSASPPHAKRYEFKTAAPDDFVMPDTIQIRTAIGFLKIPVDRNTTAIKVVSRLQKLCTATFDDPTKYHENSKCKYFPNRRIGCKNTIFLVSPTFVPIHPYTTIANALASNPDWLDKAFHCARGLTSTPWIGSTIVYSIEPVVKFTSRRDYQPRALEYIPDLVVGSAYQDNVSLPFLFQDVWAHLYGEFTTKNPDFSFQVLRNSDAHVMNSGECRSALKQQGTAQIESLHALPGVDRETWSNGEHLFEEPYTIKQNDLYRVQMIIDDPEAAPVVRFIALQDDARYEYNIPANNFSDAELDTCLKISQLNKSNPDEAAPMWIYNNREDGVVGDRLYNIAIRLGWCYNHEDPRAVEENADLQTKNVDPAGRGLHSVVVGRFGDF